MPEITFIVDPEVDEIIIDGEKISATIDES